jgi:PAS domain-containing protein
LASAAKSQKKCQDMSSWHCYCCTLYCFVSALHQANLRLHSLPIILIFSAVLDGVKLVMSITTRRRGVRLDLKLPVEYRCLRIDKGNGKYNSVTENLSNHGVCVQSMALLDVGTLCNLTLALPEPQEKIEVAGEVCWYAYEPSMGRMGIRFLEPISFFIPLRVADEAVYRDTEQAAAYFERFYQQLSDACVWVNSKGEIIRYDQRFLTLLGYSVREAKGRPLYDFACQEDRERLWHFLNPNTADLSFPVSGLFCMKPKEGTGLLWKMRLPATPPWGDSREIYIENLRELNTLQDEKSHLEKMLDGLKDTVPCTVILLNADLSIADIDGFETTMPVEEARASLKGVYLREATGLLGVKVNERTLLEELELCARRGQGLAGYRCHYEGRADNGPDIFPPGIYLIRISPIRDMEGKVACRLMVLKIEAPREIYPTKQQQGMNYFGHILGATATGFLINEALKSICDPFTRLLGSLNLLGSKLALEEKKKASVNGYDLSCYVDEVKEIEDLIEGLTRRFKYLAEDTHVPAREETGHFDLNQCLSRALTIFSLYEDLGGERIVSEPKPGLWDVEANEHEFIMIFLVVLLLSRDCLSFASDKTIRCTMEEDQGCIIVRTCHSGQIMQDRYLAVMFDIDPLKSYFVERHPMYFMDTLLYYCNLLMKKNNIKVNIDNVPGNCCLSLLIPRRECSTGVLVSQGRGQY